MLQHAYWLPDMTTVRFGITAGPPSLQNLRHTLKIGVFYVFFGFFTVFRESQLFQAATGILPAQNGLFWASPLGQKRPAFS